MDPQGWHADMIFGLLGGLVAVAGLAVAGATPGGLATAIVGGSACAVLVPIAARQALREREK